MKFAKTFTSFENGIKELSSLSFSAEQSLKWQTDQLPTTEEDAVKSLALNAAMDRQTGNGVGWGAVRFECDSYGVTYRTTGGLTFGWETALGANDTDAFEGEFVFFVQHPKGKAPTDSTLRKSAEENGWREMSDNMVALAGAATFGA